MRVSLLGPVSAETPTGPLRLGGRKQRAVFALLALQVNNPVALDRLIHELWRDEPPAQATLSLQSYISRLRRTIAEAHPDSHKDTGPHTDQPPRILTRPPGWALLMPAEDVDAVHFAHLARNGSTLLEQGEVSAGAETLREALALWSGEALADLDDMPFAAGEKTRLEDMRHSVTESLLDADLHLGRTTEVIEKARQLIAANPYREHAWCALMLALYRQGRQADALATAQDLRETLADGLGLDPSPEARRLHDQILNQDPTLDHHSPKANRVPDTALIGPVADTDEHVATDFVGRHDATVALDRVVRDAARGHGSLVVVEGPAGMGKSAILHELTTRLQTSGALVLRGGGVSAGATPALWPWVAILRQLLVADPELTGVARTSGSATALALLDPSVAAGEGEGEARDVGRDPVLARTRLYRAVVDLLSTAHRTRPLALLVDDAHWLDADTLGLMALVADELVSQGAVVAVALRIDEAPEVSAEVDAVAARHRTETVRLSLAGLDAVEVKEILQRTTPEGDHDVLAAALVARTGGNPFFVSELLRLLTSERRLDVESIESVMPEGVRDVLRRRIDRLPERTQSLLTVIALLNRPAEVRLLTGVTGLSVEAALDDAEAAVASSLLIEDPSSGAFAVTHDLVRQTLEEMVSASRRARMHARIAEVMRSDERMSPVMLPEAVVEIARHLVLAEPVVGPEAAIPYLVTVADDARDRAAFHLAERALRAALDLSARLGDPVRRTSLQLQLKTRLALQSNVISGPPGSRIFGDDGPVDPGLAPQATTDPLVWWGAAVMHVAEGRPLLALELSEQAVTQSLSASVEAVVHSVIGICHFVTGSLELADHHLEMAERMGEQVRDGALAHSETLDPWIPSMRVSAPSIRSAVAVLREDRPTATVHLDRARDRARSTPNEQVLTEHFAAWGDAVDGDPAAALKHASDAVELGGRMGDTFYVPMSRIIVGWARAMLGEESGIEVARSSYAECATMGLQFQATVHLLLCAEACANHGQVEEGRALVLESRAMAERTGERTLGARLERVAEDLLTAGG